MITLCSSVRFGFGCHAYLQSGECNNGSLRRIALDRQRKREMHLDARRFV